MTDETPNSTHVSPLRRALAVVLGVVAVAAIVAAVVVGLGDRPSGDTVASTMAEQMAEQTSDQTAAEGAGSTWRSETWGNVTVTVPSTWGQGALSDYCVESSTGELPVPTVEKPGTAQPAPQIACLNPSSGYGVKFQPASDDARFATSEPRRVNTAVGHRYPAGAWRATVDLGTAHVIIVTPDQETCRRIFDSARVDS